MSLRFHNYFRSSAPYRVRIALNLKKLAYENIPIDLASGVQQSAAFAQLNPAQLVPVLEHDGHVLTQSLAILEYLDEQFPDPPLLPRSNAADRAYVRGLALAVACDIHPLNNLRVLKRLKALGHDEDARTAWMRHWVERGFTAIEKQLAASPRRGRFCFGDSPTLADICLVPQVGNAKRVQADLAPFPTIRAIDAACAELEAFQRAHPSAQPEATS